MVIKQKYFGFGHLYYYYLIIYIQEYRFSLEFELDRVELKQMGNISELSYQTFGQTKTNIQSFFYHKNSIKQSSTTNLCNQLTQDASMTWLINLTLLCQGILILKFILSINYSIISRSIVCMLNIKKGNEPINSSILNQFLYFYQQQMCQYFTVCTSPIAIHDPRSSELDQTKLLLVDNYLIYLLPSENQLAIVEFNAYNQNVNSNNIRITPTRLLRLKNFSLQDQTHFIRIQSQSQKEDLLSRKHHFAIFTTSHIFHISLDHTFEMIEQHSTYPLLPMDNKQIMFNQQIQLINRETLYLLFVVGYVGSCLSGITYRIKSQITEQKVKLQLENRIKICVPKQLKSQFGFNISKFSDSFFINLYPLFVEKNLPLMVYQFNLHVSLKEKSLLCIQLKEHMAYQLVPLHGWFHIKCILQNEQDFYVCYTKYVKFQQNKQRVEKSQVQSLLWVYDSFKKYTKNFIDIKGAIVDIFTTKNHHLQKHVREYSQAQQYSIVVVSLQEPEVKNKTCQTTIIKMDSRAFNPRFCLPITQYPIIFSDKIVTLSNLHEQNGQLKVYKRISKNLLYAKVLETLGFNSQTLLKQVLNSV